jgi:hypothetical protein
MAQRRRGFLLPGLEGIAMTKLARNIPGSIGKAIRTDVSREAAHHEGGSLLTLPLQAPVDGKALRPFAHQTVAPVNISKVFEVKEKLHCRIPVAKDVQYCACGGVLSQRFNEALFCRTCGRDGSV